MIAVKMLLKFFNLKSSILSIVSHNLSLQNVYNTQISYHQTKSHAMP